MGANTKATIDGIEARIDRINQALPSGVRFEPYYNQADLVTKAVETVTNALLLAFVFIAIVLALCLMNLRATTLVLLSIPISIGIALMIMAWFGLSANLMSLGGIAVAIGMLVDGSVVMVENMFKHLTHPDAEHDAHRDELVENDPDPLDASHDDHGIALRLQEAGREVARPIFFATAIILVVFMPLFSFEGVEAKLFQPMAISIMLAIVSAVIVALVVVPALASFMFRKGIRERESFVLKPLEKLYRKGLDWSLKHTRSVVGAAAVLVVLAALVVPRLGTEFVPELEEGTINLRVTLAPSSSLDTALEVAPKLEAMLMEFPEVTYALSRAGRAEIGGDPEPVNNIEIYIA
nr:efflux RND transporter permease subunit [Marinobacter sp. DS40M8]